ncbi:hypothetical protein GW17_00003937 [Ensete ventricosum]|nr:hypothetical protein GW17_00003937 [Ensete ventricosum]
MSKQRMRNTEVEMEEINHRTVAVNGINMHVAEKGEGPVVLLIHGFPELWYSWRHQIVALAAHGYHAVAPDLRGFGDTDAPPAVTSYTMFHVVGDLVALIEALGRDQVSDQSPLTPSSAAVSKGCVPDATRCLWWDMTGAHWSHGACACSGRIRFQEPGRTEAEFGRVGTSLIIKKFLTYHDPGPVIVPKEKGFADAPNKENALPSWLSEEDLNYFAGKFEKSGFTGGLNYYRALDLNWELMASWTGVQIKVPVKFIVGDQDLAYHFPGVQDYICKGGFKRDVPLLEDMVVMEGVGHFINQERPQEISNTILEFIKKF